MVFLLKWILVLGLLATGAFFLLHGLGINVQLIEYQGLTAHNVPAGIALLVSGIALAAFWKVSVEEETSETTSNSNDGSSTTKTTKKVIRSLMKPRHFN